MFAAIDSYVHMRLAMLASAKHGQRGRNWTTSYTPWLGRQPLGLGRDSPRTTLVHAAEPDRAC